MTLIRRQFLRLAASAAALPAIAPTTQALDYPTRPVRLIVAFPAGSGPDIASRLVAQWLADRIGQSILVEDRPGAGGTLATEMVVRAVPDGYTLLCATSANAINAALYDNLSFNFVGDVASVARIGDIPFVMVVNPKVPVHSVPEFIAYAKANTGKVNMASAGVGSLSHVAGALFCSMTQIELLHVPYRANFLPDLLAGQVQVAFTTITLSIAHIRSGELRALGVTSARPSAALPLLPTVGAFVPGYQALGWYGIGAPKGTPPEVVDKLNRAVNAGLADRTLSARLADLGVEPTPMTPSDFGRLIAEDTEKWASVIRHAGIRPE